MDDIKQMVKAVQGYVQRCLSPFAERLKSLEDRAESGEFRGKPGADGREGPAGKDADPEFIRTLVLEAVKQLPTPKDGQDGKDAPAPDIEAIVRAVVERTPKPIDGKDGAPGAAGKDGVNGLNGAAGKDADPDLIARLVSEGIEKALPAAVEKHVDALMPDLIAKAAAQVQQPQDGKDADPEFIRAEVAKAVAESPRPQDGKNADPADIIRAAAEAVAALPKPADGKSITVADVEPVIERMVKSAVEALPPVKTDKAEVEQAVTDAVSRLPRAADGKSVTLEEVKPLVEVLVKAAVSEIPKPQDGKSVTADEVRPMLAELVAALPKPADGKSVDPQEVRDMVAREVSEIPKPADGKSVTTEDLRPMLDAMFDKALPGLVGRVEQAIAALPIPKDGKSVSAEDLRPILEAEIAKGLVDLERRATDTLQRAVDRIPAPKDGINGKDGLSLDDFDASLDGRDLSLSMRCGETVVTRTLKLAIPIYRGTFQSGQKSQANDVYTFGGALWMAKGDTDTKPPSEDWRLMVQRGRDGKDLRPADEGQS